MRKFWGRETRESKIIFYDIYTQRSIITNKMSMDEKRKYEQFDASHLPEKELLSLWNGIPWKFKKDKDNFSQSDNIILFGLYTLDKTSFCPDLF